MGSREVNCNCEDVYHYTGACLDNVYLTNGYSEFEYGEEIAVSVLDVEGLHKAIAQTVISKASKLNGKEIRFLRIEMDMAQKALAGLLGVDVQTVANWEKGVHEVNGSAERLLRLYAGQRLLDQSGEIGKFLEKFAAITNHMEKRLCFRETEEGWKEAA